MGDRSNRWYIGWKSVVIILIMAISAWLFIAYKARSNNLIEDRLRRANISYEKINSGENMSLIHIYGAANVESARRLFGDYHLISRDEGLNGYSELYVKSGNERMSSIYFAIDEKSNKATIMATER